MARTDRAGLTDGDFARRVLIGAGIVALLGLLLMATWAARDLVLILFGGVLLAVFIRALADPLAHRTGLPEWMAVAAVTLALAGILVGSAMLIGPPVARQVARVIERLPDAWATLERDLRGIGWLQGQTALEQIRDQGIRQISNAVTWVTRAITGVASTLGYMAVALVIGLYLAFQPALYRWGVANLAPPHQREHVLDVGRSVYVHLRGWLFGQLAAMAFVGVLTGLGLWALGFPMVAALAVIAFFLTFVPNLGPLATLLIAAGVALVEAPHKVLWVCALYIGVQFLETYLFTPVVQRRTATVPPALLLAAQILIGALLGMLGLLLAAPLTVAGMVLVRRLYQQDILGDEPGPEPLGAT